MPTQQQTGQQQQGQPQQQPQQQQEQSVDGPRAPGAADGTRRPFSDWASI